MASNFENVGSWRLSVAGIPFRFLGNEGGFTDEDANITVRVLVPANRLKEFILVMLPPTITVGSVSKSVTTILAGFKALAVKEITYKSQDTSMPVDPFGADPTAPDGTYYPVVEVMLKYDTDNDNIKNEDDEGDENDPLTFLTVSANVSGEYLHTPVPGSVWESPGVVSEFGVTGLVPNKNPDVAFTVTVPLTDWTVTWTRIPFVLFRDVIIGRLRALMGQVNSVAFPLLFNAEPETLLFSGYTYNQKNNWREEEGVTIPPVTIGMKFLEKRVIFDIDQIAGHNHFWKPKDGWLRLRVDGNNFAYSAVDFNNLFIL